MENERNYYLKADGTRYLDKTKKELQEMCLYPNGEINYDGLREVLKLLGYEFNPNLVLYSHDWIDNKVSPAKQFNLGKYLIEYMVINKNLSKETNLDLDDEIIQSLKKDIKSLLSKLETSLNNSNDSNYKMLINNLRETVTLKNELESKDKSNIQNYTVNIPNMNEIADYTIEKISKEMINKIKEYGMII